MGVGRLVGWQGFWTCRVGPRRLWEVMGIVMGGSGELGCGVWGREGREGVGCEPPAQWGCMRRPPWAPGLDRVLSCPLSHGLLHFVCAFKVVRRK